LLAFNLALTPVIAPLLDGISDAQPDDNHREEAEEHHIGAQTDLEEIAEHTACVMIAVVTNGSVIRSGLRP
jgi:hypothetical protein